MSLPSGYKRLEYIESSGTQYIKSGIFHNAKTAPTLRMVVDASLLSTSGVALIGTASYQSFYVGHLNGIIYYSSYYGDISTGVSYSAVTRYVYDLDNANSSFKLLSDSSTIYEATIHVNTFSGSRELYLFGYNSEDSGFANCSSQRIYSCKFYVSGTLVRDFIPCQTTAGEVGLWDDVNSVFYGNAGTGTFTAGPVKEPPTAPATLQHLLAVRIAWSAVDGATSYNVYRDDVLLTSTTETTFIDLTAAENTEYIYAVSGVGSGGESAKTTLTIYTKSGYFLYKPYIESATFQ